VWSAAPFLSDALSNGAEGFHSDCDSDDRLQSFGELFEFSIIGEVILAQTNAGGVPNTCKSNGTGATPVIGRRVRTREQLVDGGDSRPKAG